MRQAHSLFGRKFNDLNSRSGKVAEARPKTPLIENHEHEMRCQFYMEANPIRAGFHKFENLHLYKYSSFGFYAYGIHSEFTELLAPPDWYTELGKTPQIRQRRYRQLFLEYLKKESGSFSSCFFGPFIGSATWIAKQKENVCNLILAEKKQSTFAEQATIIDDST